MSMVHSEAERVALRRSLLIERKMEKKRVSVSFFEIGSALTVHRLASQEY